MTTRRVSRDDEAALRELDRLVIEAATILEGSRARRARRAEGNVVYPEDWGETLPEMPDSEPPAEPPADEVSEPIDPGDETEVPPEATADDGEDAPDESSGPLTEAETKFVEQTVRWLEGRENRDVIVDQIWRRLLGPEEPASGAPAEENDGSETDGETSETSQTPTEHPDDRSG